jgi:hypothetical protein
LLDEAASEPTETLLHKETDSDIIDHAEEEEEEAVPYMQEESMGLPSSYAPKMSITPHNEAKEVDSVSIMKNMTDTVWHLVFVHTVLALYRAGVGIFQKRAASIENKEHGSRKALKAD